ncbi:MAG: 4Fe-4S binding protein [Bacteroidetes bacterium]|nr:4Fe-4S binding protein [Bacteroidota bacterium]
MKRQIVKIDEEKCTGCGQCVPNCHEGALQIIDGKARLISDLMCDGLGACLGHCPEGAIELEEREAEPYDETAVIKEMIDKGKNTVLAHLRHLKEHNETGYLEEGVNFLKANCGSLKFDVHEVLGLLEDSMHKQSYDHGTGCPGAKAISFEKRPAKNPVPAGEVLSELRQWPLQLHLMNPQATYLKNSDLLIAADCVAYSVGDFHRKYLNGKTLAIACPKLDDGLDIYREKITAMINQSAINTIMVMIMQVPCCGGLLQLVKKAVECAERKVPLKLLVVGLQGNILQEELI